MVVFNHVFIKTYLTHILIGVELEPTLTREFIVQFLVLWQNVDVVEQVPKAATNLMAVLQCRVLLNALVTPDVGTDEYHVSRRLFLEGSPATAKGNVSSLQCVLSSPALQQKLVFGLIAKAFHPTQLWPQKLMEFIDKAPSQSADEGAE